MSRKSSKKHYWSKGRRKTAVATVRLYEGKGVHEINGKKLAEYFPVLGMQTLFNKPFDIGKCEGKFWAKIIVKGSGKQSQAEACQLAIARALVAYNESVYKPLLRKAGLLTVDSRVKERSKAGQMGKARKKKQSPRR